MKHRGEQDKNSERERRRVFVTRPIAEPAIHRLAAMVRVDLWDDEMPPPPAELRARARQADGVLSMVTDRFDAAISARCRGFARLATWRWASTISISPPRLAPASR